MPDLDECHAVLDDWFDMGEFTGLTPVLTIARQLCEDCPEFGLTLQGARAVVRTWMDCARDLGQID
jgi:hypothetical protein